MVSFVDCFDVCVPTVGCESPVDVEPCEPDAEPDESDVESDIEPVEPVESDVESDDVELDSGFDEESDADGEDVEPESDGSASATPGVFAIAAPTPSATASAPTRPMYIAVPIVVPSPVEAMQTTRAGHRSAAWCADGPSTVCTALRRLRFFATLASAIHLYDVRYLIQMNEISLSFTMDS
jgi:hypothetical protein